MLYGLSSLHRRHARLIDTRSDVKLRLVPASRLLFQGKLPKSPCDRSELVSRWQKVALTLTKSVPVSM